MLPVTNPSWTTITSQAAPADVSCHSSSSAGTTAVALNQVALARTAASAMPIPIRANVSVGIAQFPEDHLYPKELMILADQRMQQDRELRRTPAA